MSDALTEQRVARLEQDGAELRADVKSIRTEAARVFVAAICSASMAAAMASWEKV